MIRLIKNIYLSDRVFYALGISIVLFTASFWFPLIIIIAQFSLIVWFTLISVDLILIFQKSVKFKVRRDLPNVFSLGHEHSIPVSLENLSPKDWKIQMIDELPVQIQKRDFDTQIKLAKGSSVQVNYPFRPTVRGAYSFGKIKLYISGKIGLVQRKIEFNEEVEVPVYPSIIEMKNMELKALQRISTIQGIKKLRRIGHSYEFEQIKNYVQGDDYRSINWKASGRKAALMVNQYEDERAQQIYTVIDKSRAMKMPFNGMTLLDYAINSSLVISNIALKKNDRAGLITFAEKTDTIIQAESKKHQLKIILESLYKQETGKEEANYEILMKTVQKVIRGRSLIMLFSNFESNYALERVLPVLRRINFNHVLLVIFFENTEIIDYTNTEADRLTGIYNHAIGRNYISDKYQMIQTLQQYGIQTILTKPEDLSINSVNKYIELKAKGLI